MKTLNLSTGAFVLGAFAATFAACSAESSGTPPRETGGTGQTNTGGTGNIGNVAGTVGSGNTGNVGTGNTGSGGTTPIGTAGTVGTGTAGTVGTGTAGTVGTGTAGGSGMGCGSLLPNAADAKCCVATGTATDLAIDDLEDSDNTILPLGNRQGYWYSYSDKTQNAASLTTQMPTGMPFPVTPGGHACSLTPAPPACAGTTGGTVAAMGISGMVAAATATVPAYAGLGFDFNNHFQKSCPYGASAYHGITFWAKGTPFKATVKIPATTPPSTLTLGTCAAMCEDHYSQVIAPPPDGATWAQFTITFADTTKLSLIHI